MSKSEFDNEISVLFIESHGIFLTNSVYKIPVMKSEKNKWNELNFILKLEFAMLYGLEP